MLLLLFLCLPALAAALRVDVFTAGAEGYACYRIPALTRLANGTLLAFAEGRRHSCADHGYVDLVLKASHDGGASWGPLRLVRSESSASENVTIGNPAPLALAGGAGVLLPFCRNNLAAGVLFSGDGGGTWALRANISTPASWTWLATGPPASLQLPSGRVLLPVNRIAAGVDAGLVLSSDDLGLTWAVQPGAVPGGNEDQAVALPWVSPSAVLLSLRSAGGASRLAALSVDAGATWSAPWPTVAESECEASTIALPAHPAGPLLVMSSAFSALARENMTLHVSADAGRTWAPRAQVYAGSSAYSALAPLSASSVALLWERDRYAAIAFQAPIEV